ncbi:MAG: prepilin peptidase [Dehalococcoidia bacterium]|nr:MAG: prepilin peptidase [Dehalococcoidia bacterium]
MYYFYIVLFTMLGATIGSFLNVCIDRLPEKRSIILPPSSCSNCKKLLTAKDLIPIFSYLWLRGRCRYCRSTIPGRVLIVEIISAAMFPFLFWMYGLGLEQTIVTLYFCFFIVIIFIDLEHHLILNKLIYPGAIIAILFSALLSPLEIIPGIATAATGGGIGLGLFVLIVVLSRGGMGWGDVKMAALIGLIVGYPLIFVALLLAVISGGILAVILLVTKTKGRKQHVAFGPFLALGTMATILWGESILNWYIGYF